MKVGARSLPSEGQAYASPPPARRHRAAAMIVVALILLSAFIVAAPYLSSGLKQGYSFISGLEGAGTATGGTTPGNPNGGFVTSTNCSDLVSVQALGSPNINGSRAAISYPLDYCTLAAYALSQINADRASNGSAPVSLGFNQAAQQHADSMLYYGYFAHFDVQGYKPYMRYSLLGGRGADSENVAYLSYSLSHYTSTSAVEQAIQFLEHSMMYNDAACCNNGHRDNILNPLHNVVSIGVAYNGTHVFFDEEFENDYIALNFSATGPIGPNPYYVTMQGAPISGTPKPNSIYIGFDGTPSSQTPSQLNSAPHDYGPGTLVGGVLPPSGIFGCGQFTTGTTVCADRWTFTSSTVSISFSLEPFIKDYGPGVYTVYLITGSSTDSALTTISVFAP
ncbi:MAG TPA: CAP domain-containing protein [Nitrososphaerales archaeon]|nr:CAP domain-containing protein [Nitrososphaerales archaeon]